MPQPQGSTAVQSDARKNRKKQYHISYADPADGEVEVEVEVDVEVEVEVDVAFDGSRRSAGVGPNLYDIFFVWSIHFPPPPSAPVSPNTCVCWPADTAFLCIPFFP